MILEIKYLNKNNSEQGKSGNELNWKGILKNIDFGNENSKAGQS